MTQPGTIILEVYRNGQLLREERFSQSTIKIGSHARSHLCLDDASVGRVHALIEVVGGEIKLTDLGSGRGTMLNGARISKASLQHRDRIQIGTLEVVFLTRDERAEAAALAAQEAAMAAALAARRKKIKDDTVYSRRFLSRPASTDGSVELAVLYRDFVMLDEIYRPPQNVTIGPDEADFLVEHPALSAPMSLIEAEGGEPAVLFLPNVMEGEIYIGTNKFTLNEALASGRARAAGNAARLPLTQDTRVKLVLGELTFFIHRSTKPKLILPFNWAGNSLLVYIGVSLLLHALFMVLVFLMRPELSDLNMDSFDPDDRFVQIIMAEEEEEEPPPPEELFDDEGDEEEEAAAEREAGDEGRAGDENEEDTGDRMAVEGDNSPDQPTELALRQAREEASQRGVVGVMNNFGPSSLFGTEASGYDDVMAIGGVTGDNIGASYGTGGLGRYGGGLSGGGTRAGGGFGAGPIAVGGRSSGDGNLGRSEAANIDRSRERQSVAVVPGDPEIRGQLDREIIARVIREHRREVRSCYENELQRSPDLSGRIVVRFVISPDGAVASADVQESDMGSSAVESCITRRVRRWRFPEPRGGGIVRVSYPFVFTAGG